MKQINQPSYIDEALQHLKISMLYPPQKQALPISLEGKNIVVCIPTAAGKSLIAYLSILHQLMKKGGKALYIVPLRALAKEKYEDLKFLKHFGFKVGISTGDLDESDTRISRYDVIVCTSEKADSLLRHGISWVDSVNVLVIDEIHLIHDSTRGPTLEVIISRFKALNPQTQLIALSATIKNAVELSDWLDAKLISSDWRPVPLKEGVLYKKKIRYNDGSFVSFETKKNEPLHVLVSDTIDKGGQVLIFVNNRRSTVSLATKLKDQIQVPFSKKEQEDLGKLIEEINSEQMENTSIVQNLGLCILKGFAFHNAGLSSIQKKAVEQGFKERIIKCIIATPTLAAGINIPARRVIIRDLYRYDANFGMVPIPILEYKQQAGRAGRPGYDSSGEALTIAKNSEQQDLIFYNYILADTEPIYSKLGNQASLRMHLLAAIASKFVHDKQGISDFINSTFYAYQTDSYKIEQEIDESLDFLLSNDFITKNNDYYIATLFGTQTSSLYIDPLSALQMKKSLMHSHKREITPLSFLHTICSTPDVRSLYLRGTDSWVEENFEQYKNCFLLTVPSKVDNEFEWFLSDLKTALLLQDWINEISYDRIVSKYNIWPGDIHNIVEISEWLLHALREFARMYEYSYVSDITDLIIRVRNGCRQELLNLIELKGIGRVRARAIFNEGFKTINDLRGIPVERLAQIKTIGPAIAADIKKQIAEDKQKGNKKLDGI
ncbi:MAG: DEAD/DEAH box helicase [Thermoplasmatota archaeon]